jgi:hypothetical protein
LKGYLQRLVASARQADPRLHPVVAPMFSETALGVEAEQSLASPEPLTSNARSSSTYLQTDEPTAARIAAVPGPHPLKRWDDSSIQHMPEKPDVRQPVEAPPAENPVPIKQASSAGRISRSRTHAIEYRPLLHETGAPPGAAADDSGPVPAEYAASLARRDDGRRERTVAPPQSEPDEIHITIGRIEVAAVREPRALPAVKPPRRHLTLDDYLKRADARRR